MAEELEDRVELSHRCGASAWIPRASRSERSAPARPSSPCPPALAGRIEYEPALPAARDQLTQRMPMGSVIKCMAVYEEPFWRERGLTGQAVSLPGPAGDLRQHSRRTAARA